MQKEQLHLAEASLLLLANNPFGGGQNALYSTIKQGIKNAPR